MTYEGSKYLRADKKKLVGQEVPLTTSSLQNQTKMNNDHLQLLYAEYVLKMHLAIL